MRDESECKVSEYDAGWVGRRRAGRVRLKCPPPLGGFDQVIDVDVKVIIVFDVVDRGFGWDLVDDQACSLHTLVGNILHLLPHQALRLLSGLPVRWQQVLVL